MLPKRFVESGLRPDTLTITIRHSDWLGAEQSLRWALTLNKESVYAVLDLKAVAGVKTFNLELEAARDLYTEILDERIQWLSDMALVPDSYQAKTFGNGNGSAPRSWAEIRTDRWLVRTIPRA
ncbi:hypothetical protein LTR09_011700 [Extremus antarcticus]|uniref:Uncharacterized protein n=1 Tax=Extremus antarcticus TaxID=702011 RepID=A0AAJ0D5R6_9PEZI|nr:hypothetical protein LTR09_011700 [Extremus antarcticus]